MCADVWDGFTGDDVSGGGSGGDADDKIDNQDAAGDDERVTQLRLAWAWTCDDCGQDNFSQMPTEMARSLRDRGIDVDDKVSDDEGVITAPEVVKCKHCNAEFATIPPDGMQDASGGACDDDDCDDEWNDDEEWSDGDDDEWCDDDDDEWDDDCWDDDVDCDRDDDE